MTELLEAVGTYLAANGCGTLGETIWLGNLMETPDACLAVLEYEGETPVMTMSGPAVQLERPRLQVVARGPREDYEAARTAVLAARVLLAAVTDQTIGGLHVLRIEPVGRISPLGHDSGDRPRLAANFRVLL